MLHLLRREAFCFSVLCSHWLNCVCICVFCVCVYICFYFFECCLEGVHLVLGDSFCRYPGTKSQGQWLAGGMGLGVAEHCCHRCLLALLGSFTYNKTSWAPNSSLLWVAKTNKLNFEHSIATAAGWNQLCQRLRAGPLTALPAMWWGRQRPSRGRPWGYRLVNPVTDWASHEGNTSVSRVSERGRHQCVCRGVSCVADRDGKVSRKPVL